MRTDLLLLVIAAAFAGTLAYLTVIAVRPRWLERHGLLAPLFEAGIGGHLRAILARFPHMLLLAAHYGIILNHVQQLLKLFHFGSAVEIMLEHERMDLLVHAVGHGYYVVLAVQAGAHLGVALREMRECADALRLEVA